MRRLMLALGPVTMTLALSACDGVVLDRTTTTAGSGAADAGGGHVASFGGYGGASAGGRGGAGGFDSAGGRPGWGAYGGVGPGTGAANTGGAPATVDPGCRGVADAQQDPMTGHCYVDRSSADGATYAGAEAACSALAPGFSHLPTLHSDAEQSFVVASFLVTTRDTHDAWLGLTCPEATHPAFVDCYCPGGCSSPFERNLALQSWGWTDGTMTPFLAWSGPTPDGAGRAATLGSWGGIWGWVDRDEAAASAKDADGPRTHRVICEIE